MKSKCFNLIIRTLGIGLLILLVGCDKLSTDNGPQVPANTVGSFNFTSDNGKGGLVILNMAGEKVKAVKLPKPGKVISEATLKFIQVNPCYVQVCSGSDVCATYLISPGACPPGF